MPRTPSIAGMVRHRRALGRLCLLLVALIEASRAAGAQPAERLGRLAAVESWGYQLQDLDIGRLAASPHDLLVIDFSRGGTVADALNADEIARIKKRPNKPDRVVLAYLSIGEAETYRDYWRWYWGGRWFNRPLGWLFAPAWLGGENREWHGNYAVRYWDESWQRIILGSGVGDGYLDTIITAGFDGVYLDKIDTSIEAVARGRATAKDDMRAFVRRIAEAGRAKRPGFLVVPQNGEELLDDDAFVQVIDGFAKEDLLFGEFKDKNANPETIVTRRLGLMEPLSARRKTVLAVEYLDDRSQIAGARQRLQALGYVAHFADRELKSLRYGDDPASAKSGRR